MIPFFLRKFKKNISREKKWCYVSALHLVLPPPPLSFFIISFLFKLSIYFTIRLSFYSSILKESIWLSCCKFWMYRVAVNIKFCHVNFVFTATLYIQNLQYDITKRFFKWFIILAWPWAKKLCLHCVHVPYKSACMCRHALRAWVSPLQFIFFF